MNKDERRAIVENINRVNALLQEMSAGRITPVTERLISESMAANAEALLILTTDQRMPQRFWHLLILTTDQRMPKSLWRRVIDLGIEVLASITKGDPPTE